MRSKIKKSFYTNRENNKFQKYEMSRLKSITNSRYTILHLKLNSINLVYND